MEWNVLFELLKEAGPAGMIVGVLVLLFVYAGTFTDVFKTGQWKRWASVIASYLFAGVEPGNSEAAMTGAIGLAVATLLKFLVDLAIVQVKATKAKK